MNRLLAHVDALLVAPARPYSRPGSRSGIDKRVVDGVLMAGPHGAIGDEQGDPRVHGGIDKALHHYPREHYAAWRAELGEHPLLAAPGAFGENISTQGLTEAQLCLGDRLRIGEVLVEVSQGRQPCWKLDDRFGVPDMALRVQATLRTGWYYRVLEPGAMRAGDPVHLVERAHPQWPLTRLMTLLWTATPARADLAAALALPLVPSWRRVLQRRHAGAGADDGAARLRGPMVEPPATR